jgi:hypothetical protein
MDADYWKLFAQCPFHARARHLRAPRCACSTPWDEPTQVLRSTCARGAVHAGGQDPWRFRARRVGVLGQTIVLTRTASRSRAAARSRRQRRSGATSPALSDNLFVDGGNVWRNRRLDLRGKGAPVSACAVLARRAAPARIGWKLDREEFEDPFEAFISLGNAF